MATLTDSYVHPFGEGVIVEGGQVRVVRESVLESDRMDRLVRDAVFGLDGARAAARWLIWEIGQRVGVRPASIEGLYMARGRGLVSGFTVPAINVRGMAYDTARSLFRSARRLDVGAFICEIARSEIGYTDQRPAEYVAVMLAAALREGFRGPVFIQGDHFQVNAKKYAVDPDSEVNAVKQLTHEAVAAGFWNIDVDTSTLVDLHRATLADQQRLNVEAGADITAYVRSVSPIGVTISVGGEIGEVGTQNSTVEELRAYLDGLNARLAARGGGRAIAGLSKVSVQSGTTHGGVVLPDGSIADVKIDFDTLANLSRVARTEYGLAGAVQHGASTLPDAAFNHFPRTETAEIHLATNFQNMLYDLLPNDLREEIYEWLRRNAADERKPTDTDDQFIYKTRKKAIGPFKRSVWDLPDAVKRTMSDAYDAKFQFLFEQLGVRGTKSMVSQYVEVVEHHRPEPAPHGAGGAGEPGPAPDDTDLSD
jgi:fructose-bisphosphate aldolase, class II